MNREKKILLAAMCTLISGALAGANYDTFWNVVSYVLAAEAGWLLGRTSNE